MTARSRTPTYACSAKAPGRNSSSSNGLFVLRSRDHPHVRWTWTAPVPYEIVGDVVTITFSTPYSAPGGALYLRRHVSQIRFELLAVGGEPVMYADLYLAQRILE